MSYWYKGLLDGERFLKCYGLPAAKTHLKKNGKRNSYWKGFRQRLDHEYNLLDTAA